jgi:hypothetical protein
MYNIIYNMILYDQCHSRSSIVRSLLLVIQRKFLASSICFIVFVWFLSFRLYEPASKHSLVFGLI